MKIPLSWLKETIALDETAEQIAERLTLAGLEVDSVEPAPLSFEGVVVGEVISTEKHPDADKLQVAQVSDGTQTVQVVCGGANCRPGLKTPFARVGARLDNGNFKIKKGKIRGVESFGMLCAWVELGLGAEEPGIAELPADATVGQNLAELFGDTILEISLTPNLGHCQSVLGVARELSAATGAPVKLTDRPLKESGKPNPAQVTIEELNACPAYTCRVIRGVKVGPSTQWVIQRLEACGMRTVNNVVDATNLVMIELGHPLHAFDLKKVAQEKIVVRTAKTKEKLTTLDGKEQPLAATTLLICDSEKPIAIAGVMGGANSEVSEATTDLLIESAYFAPPSIRAASKQLQLITESSRRFERGTDPNGMRRALDRVCALIQELAGGEVAPDVASAGTDTFPKRQVAGRFDRINRVLGTKLSSGEVEELLRRLEFDVMAENDDRFSVKVPTYRNDIFTEIDLIEEVGRLYGYHNIERRATTYQKTSLPHTPLYLFEKELRSQLIAAGLQEVVTNNLISAQEASLSPLPESMWVRVLNAPADHQILCPSLLPGLLKVVRHNQHHGASDIAAFEIGRVHFKQEEFQEQTVAAIVVAGRPAPHFWGDKKREADFYDLKGVIEATVPQATFHPSALPTFHPGRQAAVHWNGMEVGAVGEVHPSLLRTFDVKGRLLFATLNLNDLMAAAPPATQFAPLPQYPGSERDWTLSMREELAHQALVDAIHSVPSRLLKKVSLLDIYRGEKVEQGWKRATYRFTYRDDKKTVALKSVESEHTRITQGVLAALTNNVRSTT